MGASRPVIPVLAGPTAVGKTARALEWAASRDAEIVSADSRQIYRPLTIGTAKPSPEELAAVPHHFIDELDLDELFSAGMFARQGEARIHDILRRGRLPLVTGGSTLYLEALVHGLPDIPETSAETRRHLTLRLEAEGAAALYEELARVDPASAAAMDPTKTQRVVRALEVYSDTGRPLSSFRTRVPPAFDYRVTVLVRPRDLLYRRVEARVDAMLAAGLIEENRALLEAGYPPSLNPLRTIGYREPMAYLRGDTSFEEMTRQLKQNSRRYAKRQMTWFRRFPEYEIVELQ